MSNLKKVIIWRLLSIVICISMARLWFGDWHASWFGLFISVFMTIIHYFYEIIYEHYKEKEPIRFFKLD
jgi:uncharacterized membrane protein YjjP (DUF1212 family)